VFLDNLYQDAELLGRHDFDVELAAAHRLGVHIRDLAGTQAGRGLLAILDDPGRRARLANDIGRAATRSPRRIDALADGVRGT
jgi:predicted nucleotidyltransferase